jgi:transposase
MSNDTATSENSGVTVGLDLGDRDSHFCLLDAKGQVLATGKAPTTLRGLTATFERFRGARIVLECGTHSPWVSRVLKGMGLETLVLDARSVAIVTRSTRKSDKHDALTLARLGRTDASLGLLRTISHRPAAFQEDLSVIRARDSMVRSRTMLVNTVRSLMKSSGERLPVCSTPSFATKVAKVLPRGLAPACEPLLAAIADLTARIKEQDKTIERMIDERYPAARLLQQIPGVGPLTALTYVLTLFDPDRFAKSRQVGAYLGLVPRRHQSGQRDPHLGITHAGNPYLRQLLVSAAHYIIGPFGPPSDLREWGLSLASRGPNAKKRAVVAVARRLAVLLHRLWLTGEVYEPCRRNPREVAA